VKVRVISDKLPIEFVKIHKAAFKDFFLTSLGDRFLSLYYKSVLKSSRSIVLSLEDDENSVIGFAVGTLVSMGFHKNIIIRNFFRFSLVFILILFTKPKSIIRLFKNINKRSDKVSDEGLYAELLSIAVLPEYNGIGYGKLLLTAFEEEVKKNNTDLIALTTDFYSNEEVVCFYKNKGYEIFYDFTTYPNRRMYKLIKKL